MYIIFSLFLCIDLSYGAMRLSRDILLQDKLKNLKKIVQEQLLTQMNSQFGWNHGETPQAVVALSLGNDEYFDTSDLHSALILKQLKLELAEVLFRWNQQQISAGELALFINALLATCQDPKHFFDVSLISRLQNMTVTSDYEEALISLTLCNVGHHLPKATILHLSSFFNISSGVHDGLDLQAMALLALACSNIHFPSTYLRSILNQPLIQLKSKQKEDGSFGNVYTTALVTQALIAVGDIEESWQLENTLNYIAHIYEAGNLNTLSHFLVLPILNMKSLANLKATGCCCYPPTENEDQDDHFDDDFENDVWFHSFGMDDDNHIHSNANDNAKSSLIAVTYSLWHHTANDGIGNKNISTVVFIDHGETFLHVMQQAATADERFLFTAKNYSYGLLVESLAGVKNSVKDKLYWLLYQIEEPRKEPKIVDKGISDIKPENEDHFLFWYRQL